MIIWISIGQVAKLYGVTTQTIRNWTKYGEFTSVRTRGNHRRYDQSEIYSKLGW